MRPKPWNVCGMRDEPKLATARRWRGDFEIRLAPSSLSPWILRRRLADVISVASIRALIVDYLVESRPTKGRQTASRARHGWRKAPNESENAESHSPAIVLPAIQSESASLRASLLDSRT